MAGTVDAPMELDPEKRFNYLLVSFESLQDAMDRTEYMARLQRFREALDKRLQGDYW
jgi:hypothetical protein